MDDDSSPEPSSGELRFRERYANWRGLRSVCLTFDIDFAPDYMIDHLAEILDPYGIEATFFVTHASDAVRGLACNPRYEIGYHPNLSPGSTQGDSLPGIIASLRTDFPGAVGNRFHLLGSSYRDLAVLGRSGFRYDASTLRFDCPYLLPSFHQDIGLTLLTYFWEDGIAEAARVPLRLPAVDLRSPGMKMFNFHPLNVFLNAPDASTRLRFLAEHPDLTHCPARTAERYRHTGDGAATLLGELLAHLSARGCAFVRASAIDTAYREVLAGSEAAPHRTASPQEREDADAVRRFHRRTDPARLIGIRSGADVDRGRREVCRLLWGEPEVPRQRLPDEVVRGVREERFAGLPGGPRVDRIEIGMAASMRSVAHLIHPAVPNGRAVVYHHGHTHDTDLDVLRALLDAGYAVLAFWMPFTGPNPGALEVESDRFGLLRLRTHDDLSLLEPSLTGSPLQFFVEPVVVGLNTLQERYGYDGADMVGLSGGGWTTTVCAALDPRIRWSYPVAGTLPLWLRVGTKDWPSGDYEENEVALYAVANYLELYVLGSTGEGRGQLQVLNRYDDRCFAGTRHELYEAAVSASVAALGPGRFSVLLDASHRAHAVSPAAIETILEDMEGRARTQCQVR